MIIRSGTAQPLMGKFWDKHIRDRFGKFFKTKDRLEAGSGMTSSHSISPRLNIILNKKIILVAFLFLLFFNFF